MPGLEDLKLELPGYLAEMRRRGSQPGKEIIFTKFIERVFGISPEEIEMEVPIESKVMLVRGRVDAVFGKILMEFKVNLKAELDDAKVELTKYFQAYYEKFPERSYIGIAHDGLAFVVFQPILSLKEDTGKPYVSSVRQTDQIDLEKEQDLERIFLWFDAYLFVSERAVPTSADIRKRLGTESPTFYGILGKFEFFYEVAMKNKRNQIKYQNWARTLEIVYGGRVEGKALFIRHTYLATVAKLLVYLIVSGAKVVSKAEVRAVMYGEAFATYGISNFIEEDFYTWVLDKEIRPQALEVISSLMKELMVYDLERVDEDFLKSLYEELVDPELRHDLGEYYTPDWLADYVVNDVVPKNPEGTLLDPACGSGTFLFSAIRKKIELLRPQKSSSSILEQVTNTVVGADVHPLAVIIARTNYLLALKGLLQERGKALISIPVYLCDTLRLPKVSMSVQMSQPEYRIAAVENKEFGLPLSLIKNPRLLDLLVDRLGAAAKEYERVFEEYPNRAKSLRIGIEEGFNSSMKTLAGSRETAILFASNLKKLLDLVEAGANSIWSFILKNVYKPVSLADRQFDCIVGNPPWIAMRYIENRDYQNFLKEEALHYQLLESKQIHLFTQMEIATLFFRRAAELYLKDGGTIAFVMPRSVLTGATQHERFRRMNTPAMTLTRILDLEKVSPLFNVPSCVLISRKGGKTSYPVQSTEFSGKLVIRNSKLEKALDILEVKSASYQPPNLQGLRSPYYDKLKAGAAIYPRPLVFVDFDVHPTLGISLAKPRIKTAEDVSAATKEQWKGVTISGNADASFIFATIVGGEILPFAYSRIRPVVLPVEPAGPTLRLLEVKDLKAKGFEDTADWFAKVQSLWEEKSSAKSRQNFPRFISSIDYQGLLSSQNPRKKYLLIYAGSGSNVASCVIDRNDIPPFKLGPQLLKPALFVVDKTAWYIETDSLEEAHYLCAVLNSDVVNDTIKPLQTRGLFGERHIHRRPFLLPIPRFDEKNQVHLNLSSLSRQCHTKLTSASFDGINSGRARAEARHAVDDEIQSINKMVKSFLSM
jgi:hypothetical protein